MFKFFSYNKSFLMVGKILVFAVLLFVVIQTPELKAQSLVEKAKKEGRLTLYTSMQMAATEQLMEAFTKKYPFIKFEFVRLGSTRLLQKLIMEKEAGVKKADVVFATLLVNIYKKEGLIQKYVSPEAKNWPKGFQDPEGYWTAVYNQYYNFMYNTRMVSEKEAPKSYEDLLDPKWKGKIGMSNRSYIWYMGIMDLMGRDKGLQFIKRLADQDIQFHSGRTLTAQLLASGEFALAGAVLHRSLILRKKGAPVKWTNFDTPALAEMRSFVLHADAPNSNAGKLFIDFMLSKEGQIVIEKGGRHPIRLDVEVDPVVEKFRRNLLPIKLRTAEETTAYMKECNKIFLKRF